MRAIFWQYLIPHHLLSRIVGSLACCEISWVKNTLIRAFIKRYHVDMQLAEEPDYTRYPSFNAFFTRKLKKGIRPIVAGENIIVSPADGAMSQYGRIDNAGIFQAKGHHYSVKALLGGSDDMASLFQDGHFSTIYLAPKDYHRVHMPLSGNLQQMTYIPGKLFSVNSTSVQYIPGLFAKNERVCALFENDAGYFAVVLVGAMIVASIETVWSGLVAPQRTQDIVQVKYTDADVSLQKGDEMGQFQLGSTVIVLFANKNIVWASDLAPDNSLIMGQKLGEIL